MPTLRFVTLFITGFILVINGEKATLETPTFAQKRRRTLDMLIRSLYQDLMPDLHKVTNPGFTVWVESTVLVKSPGEESTGVAWILAVQTGPRPPQPPRPMSCHCDRHEEGQCPSTRGSGAFINRGAGSGPARPAGTPAVLESALGGGCPGAIPLSGHRCHRAGGQAKAGIVERDWVLFKVFWRFTGRPHNRALKQTFTFRENPLCATHFPGWLTRHPHR